MIIFCLKGAALRINILFQSLFRITEDLDSFMKYIIEVVIFSFLEKNTPTHGTINVLIKEYEVDEEPASKDGK